MEEEPGRESFFRSTFGLTIAPGGVRLRRNVRGKNKKKKRKEKERKKEKKYEKSHRAPLLSNHEREKHRVFTKPGQKWRWPTLKPSTRDFSPVAATAATAAPPPPPAVYRPRETAFFAVKPVASLCHSPLGRLHLRPRPRPRPRSFSRGTFPCPPKRNEYTRRLCPAFCNSGERS
jgi:hypothetical protein